MRNVLEIKDGEHERDRRYFADYIRDSILYYGNNSHDPDCYRRLKLGMKLEIDMPEHHYNNIMAVDSMSLGRVPYKGIIMYAINAIKRGKVLEQEPTTKNDLGVDYISREQALVAIRNLYPGMPRVDFNGSLRKWVDKYKPYIECDDAIKELPSVTPQEPKTGHWIKTGAYYTGAYDSIDYVECSCCHYESLEEGDYCPNCGAKMVESQESEET